MEETKDLAQISTEIQDVVASNGHTACDCEEHATSRGESEPQPFKKNMAEELANSVQPTITKREVKYLKRARYEQIAEKFQNAYVIKNKRTGLVVEIRAASAYHAANIIGWKPRHTQLLEVVDTNKKTEETKAVESV